jgi:hypothetical protein
MPFIFGLLAAAMALLTQLVVWLFYPPLFEVTQTFNTPTLTSLFLLAFIEESTRVSFANQYKKVFGDARAVAILAFALGFASLEVALALVLHSRLEALGTALFLPLGIHILLTFLAFFGLRLFTQKKSVSGLFLALVLLHFLFNTLLLFL